METTESSKFEGNGPSLLYDMLYDDHYYTSVVMVTVNVVIQLSCIICLHYHVGHLATQPTCYSSLTSVMDYVIICSNDFVTLVPYAFV